MSTIYSVFWTVQNNKYIHLQREEDESKHSKILKFEESMWKYMEL